MRKKISKYMVLLCIAILTAVIPLASADNVEPSSISVSDTNGNGVIDVNDNKTITFWVTGAWQMTAYNPSTETTSVIASGTGIPSGKVTVNITDYDILIATNDDPETWDHGIHIYREITILIWSHDKVNGYTQIVETAEYWYDWVTYETWLQTHSFVITWYGQAEIPEFPTIIIPAAAVIGLVFIFNNRRNTRK